MTSSHRETSGDEFEVNKVNRNGKQGYSNNYKKVIMVTTKIIAEYKKTGQVKSGNKKRRILNHINTGIITFCSH